MFSFPTHPFKKGACPDHRKLKGMNKNPPQLEAKLTIFHSESNFYICFILNKLGLLTFAVKF